MPISYKYIHRNFLETNASVTMAEILLRIVAIPEEERRDLFLLVKLDPEGFAVVSLDDLTEVLESQGARIMDTPLSDIQNPNNLDQPLLHQSGAVERADQGYGEAENLQEESYKRRLVVLEMGDPVGLLIPRSLAPSDDISEWFAQATPSGNQRFVNLDFATQDDPANPCDHYLSLQPVQTYYFYVEIGEAPGGLDEKAVPLPDLPAGAELEVVVFGYPGGLQVRAGADRGHIKLNADGTSSVIKRVEEPTSLLNSPLLQNRLYFRVTTPVEAGEHRLRCLIYYQQALVQARIIFVLVGPDPQPAEKPVMGAQVVDYSLSHSLNPAKMDQLAETHLSIFMNDNKDGTHSLLVKGLGLPEGPPMHLDEELVKGWIRNIRGDLRQAAWGDREGYTNKPKKKNRYKLKEPRDLNKLQVDLIRLALSGYQIYDGVLLSLGQGFTVELKQLLQETREVQFSAIENVTSVVPVAAIYDQPLDTSYLCDLSKYDLCSVFKSAFDQNTALEETACFKGTCPSYDDDRVVCPSGFWGYRHNLGVPVSVGQAPFDAATLISSISPIEVSVGLSTAPSLKRRDIHQRELNELQEIGVEWEYYGAHEQVIEMLQHTEAPIIYFYCHGGFDKIRSAPFLSFDANPTKGPRFYPDLLRTKNINWLVTKPLVFINGCYTTALDPEKTMNFVDRFVQFAHAAGVIGTEITIFEGTATMFSKEFFQRFLIERQRIGEAVRGARLNLLQKGSPFGLVYIPFVSPALRLENRN